MRHAAPRKGARRDEEGYLIDAEDAEDDKADAEAIGRAWHFLLTGAAPAAGEPLRLPSAHVQGMHL
eukprot:3290671-Prymnesium_polylepis.1